MKCIKIINYTINIGKVTWFWQSRAKLFNCLATSGCPLPSTASLISKALLHNGSASLYLPRFP